MAKKTKRADFRITDEESEHLRQAAKDAELNFSDYLRALVLDRTVLVVGDVKLVVIPAASTSTEADKKIEARIQALIRAAANGQSPSEAAPPAPAAPPLAAVARPPAAPPHSDSASPPSPSEPDGMVGKPSSDEALAVDTQAAGTQPPGSAEICPGCGGSGGQHQSYCETVRGVPPVEPRPEEASSAGGETEAQFLERRMAEGEIRAVAEAEWRQVTTQPAPPPPVAGEPGRQGPTTLEPCPNCGAMKNPAAQCRDCGRRPDVP